LDISSGTDGDLGYSILMGKSENQFMSMQEILRWFYDTDEDRRIKIIEKGLIYFKNLK
jgi:hypothetical protein